MSFDPIAFGEQVGTFVRELVAPLERRIAELERAPAPVSVAGVFINRDGELVVTNSKGETTSLGKVVGRDGSDAKVDESAIVEHAAEKVADLIPQAVRDAVARHLTDHPPKDGKDGEDADPVDVSSIARDAAQLVRAEIVSEIEKRLPDESRLSAAIDAAVKKHLADNPPAAGKDGVGLASMMIDRAGDLVATMTDGKSANLGPVVGKDGLGFDDIDVIYDGRRNFTIRFVRGSQVVERSFRVPTVIDCGYWRDGMQAKAGDGYTHDGTWWICVKDTDSRPTIGSDDWRIGARKGRDGRDGEKMVVPADPVSLK